MVNIKKIVAGYLKTNSYLVSSDTTNTAVLIDGGGGLDRIDAYLKENNLKLVALLLTHGHFDHITIANALKQKFNMQIYIHNEDAIMLKSEDNLANMTGIRVEKCDADVLLNGDETLSFGEMSFKVIHTPGHSRGSVVYILNDKYMFSGDTLFRDSFGATHFYGGSMEEMKKSLFTLFSLYGDMPVYCGHEEDTSLEYERENNPINYV